ncbi:FAD-dependent oxidoreductase [Polyangium sp. 15x6]|uniref:FAD-dependent oxidoreductase n=1 Tax=Polyangium sp. 15x6 TaxID=3042687 RepID=UPI002499D7A8|nr:FAD-dependent oxidoreductase [Polyangium sp. 15x6]MDI3289014.1 FAD-dependent oxidoreductase [Polyangium sp. 15x6]
MTARVAIVGGGPGGLFTAYMLNDKLWDRCAITLYEASSRLGGKISTAKLGPGGPVYEAGVAEIYDYSMIGYDPLRTLVEHLGLGVLPMSGGTVLLGDRVLRNIADIRQLCGDNTASSVEAFRAEAMRQLSREDYYDSHWTHDNAHAWARKTCREILDRLKDEDARRYFEVAAHSDIATEPHLTNGLNGLKNFLMDVPGYMRLYTIEGGIERLVDRLSGLVKADIRLGRRVVSVERGERGYRVVARHGLDLEEAEYDFVVIALPHDRLSMLEWKDPRLARAMQTHVAHYDRPAHYLRVSVLFSRPFWRDAVPGSYFMIDTFGGTCLYDEGSRYGDAPGKAVLGWLLAGSAAQTLANSDDATLIREVLDALPPPLRHGRELALEGRVHRWLSSVNGLPGGFPTPDMRERHVPEPKRHPGLFLVGDYLFDSTLNGVLDSADFATDCLTSEVFRGTYLPEAEKAQDDEPQATKRPHEDERPAITIVDGAPSEDLDPAYHDFYDGESSYEASFNEYFDARYVVDLIEIIWGAKPPYKLLDCGAANGITLEEFAKLDVDAWGIEKSAYIHGKTAKKWKARNALGDVCAMPFPDDEFDFLYDTALCYVPQKKVGRAIREMARVCKRGVFFGSIASDMTQQVIDAHDLFSGVSTLSTLWEWSEQFLANGFRFAVVDPKPLAWAFARELSGSPGEHPWYPTAEAMRYCFYTKVPRRRKKKSRR